LSILLKLVKTRPLQKNSIVRFYQTKREIVPFWLLIHEMSFGEISEIYRIMSPMLREMVYRQFEEEIGSPRKYFKFERDLEFITKIRNTVNHYESFIVMLDIDDPLYESTRDAIQRLIRFSNKSFIGYEKTPIDFAYKASILRSEYNQKYRDRIDRITEIIDQ
jgi:abortive infection bacteriophage resistance protein